MRAPMQDIDLMVLGDVGASTPLPSSTWEHRIQFASRTREPASRLLPLMARTPKLCLAFLYPVRDPMRGTTDFQGFRSYSGVETSLRGGSPVVNPMRGTPFPQDLDRGDGLERNASRK